MSAPAAPAPIPERLKWFEELELDTGSHQFSNGGKEPSAACAMEALAWVVGEGFTDHPKCVSPVLVAIGRRLNDNWDDENRQRLKPYLLRMVGTAGDGKDELRGWIAADWAIREATPVWLEVAGVTEAASALRELPPIVDRASYDAAYNTLRPIRDDMWKRRSAARERLKKRVEEELRKLGKPAADAVADAVAAADAAAVAVAVAVAAAVAVAVAAAVADAVAAAVADAVAAAVAAAAADADAVADAAADAAADAVAVAVAAADADAAAAADAAWDGTWSAAYNAAKKVFRDKWLPIFDEKVKAAGGQGHVEASLALLDRMIDPELAAA